MLLTRLAQYTNATLVGKPSASRPNHYGDSRRVVLPNSGLTVRVATLWWQYGDPRDARPWLPPGVAVPVTAADYAAGRDPVLAAALRLPCGGPSSGGATACGPAARRGGVRRRAAAERIA